MKLAIVEGEPGIFPDPVARLLRLLARPFRNRQTADRDRAPSEDVTEGEQDVPPS